MIRSYTNDLIIFKYDTSEYPAIFDPIYHILRVINVGKKMIFGAKSLNRDSSLLKRASLYVKSYRR